MLVLSRKCGEWIMIGPDIEVRILDIQGNRVQLGISAPASVRIDRQEVRDARLADSARGKMVFAVIEMPSSVL